MQRFRNMDIFDALTIVAIVSQVGIWKGKPIRIRDFLLHLR